MNTKYELNIENEAQFLISSEEFGMFAVNCPECNQKILVTRLRAHMSLNHK